MQIEDLKIHFKQLTDRVDVLSLRERGIIFVTILVVLYMVAVNLLFSPLQAERDRLQKQINTKRDDILKIENQVQIVLTGGVNDPDSAKRQRLTALQENLKILNESLEKVTTGLVSPKEMTRLLERVLGKNQGLQVVKMESLPASPLIEEGVVDNQARTGSAKESAANGRMMVYKHGMRIELKGSYLDILRYLRSLEGLPWKVFWGQATLQTEKYPVSKLTLLIYTLSTNESWIAI
jgi:MSHA biogenesis protein MshJ